MRHEEEIIEPRALFMQWVKLISIYAFYYAVFEVLFTMVSDSPSTYTWSGICSLIVFAVTLCKLL